MNFSYEIRTLSLISDCTNPKQIHNLLCNAYIHSNSPKYSDIGAIIIVDIIDTIHGIGFFRSYIKKIWTSLNMQETFWHDEIPQSYLSRVQSYDKEYRVASDNNKLISINTPLGIVHDTKSRQIGASGHAGIFSTPHDIAIFCEALLNYSIISKVTINSYITSSKYDTYAIDYNQHYGLLCYKKTDNDKTSEIPLNCNNNCIAISGYTGCYLLIDFDNDKFFFIGSNRIYNRITSKDSQSIEELKNTSEYVYRKDALRNLLVACEQQ